MGYTPISLGGDNMSNIIEFINNYSMWFIAIGGSLYVIFTILEIVYSKKMRVAQCSKCIYMDFCCDKNKSKKFCDKYKPIKEL